MSSSYTRRQALGILGGAGFSLMLEACSARSLPLQNIVITVPDSSLPFSGLVTSLTEEYDYPAAIDGDLPQEIRGTLYRVGPALFERGGLRRRMLMDGDGMVHSFTFGPSRVTFRNRFVRTQKFLEEERAGTFLYPSFSTQAPGGMLANLMPGGRILPQAHITVVMNNGKLFAFDETSYPYELDPDSLETVGPSWLGLPERSVVLSAHSKIDRRNREWLLYGLHYGKNVTLHTLTIGNDGATKIKREIRLPRYVVFHDFMATENYLLFVLHPLEMSIGPFLLGMKSMADCLSWRPELGNLLFLLPRHHDGNPVLIEADSCFMWHAVNAYELNGEIIADFIGYDHPDHFLDEKGPVRSVMTGKPGTYRHRGKIRRYRIDAARRTVRQEIYGGSGYEWPMMNPQHRCHPYRLAYCAKSREGDFFWSGLSRVDLDTGKEDSFFFGQSVFCGEPVFVPLPGCHSRSKDPQEPGWLMTEAYDGASGKSFLSVFRAERLSDGPVATIKLTHPIPFSMHGFWQGSI